MAINKGRQALHSSAETPADEVLILADAVGTSATTLTQVMNDFLQIVSDPIIAGGFAMAHHGLVRATVDIDVMAMGSIHPMIEQFKSRGYKHESIQLPIGALDLLTKGNKGVDFIHLSNEKFRKSIQKRAVEGTFFSQKVRFVALEDLILLKLLAVQGRKNKMDGADLDTLLPKPHDKTYVDGWKKILGI
jgi:hypothetical protein